MIDIIKTTEDFKHPKAKGLIERFNPNIVEIAPRTNKIREIMKDSKTLIRLTEESKKIGIINPYNDYIISAACSAVVDYELCVRKAFMIPTTEHNIITFNLFRSTRTIAEHLESGYNAERLIESMITAQERYMENLT